MSWERKWTKEKILPLGAAWPGEGGLIRGMARYRRRTIQGRIGLGTDQGKVAVEYPRPDHRVTLDPKTEASFPFHLTHIDGEVTLNILDGQMEMTGPDCAVNRERKRLADV